MENQRILIVDDDPDILVAAAYLLERHYQSVTTCSDPEEIPALFQQHGFDLTLLDMNFHPGNSDGEEGKYWLQEIRKAVPDAVVVMITAHGSMSAAIDCMKLGAADYVVKPWDNQRLLATISAALELRKSRAETQRLKQSQRTLLSSTSKQQTILGNSRAMAEVLSLVERAAPTDANVLILGENGTGKELAAREIHQQSARSDQVFVPVDLGSIAESLFESELFGHVKGAFTGAKENRIGFIEAADGGSLFLDEIGNLPLHLQAKLLSVLEKREVVPVGASKAVTVNVRVIAATNMPLSQLKNPNYFRQDLLFRLNTVEIELPPLRDRIEDIPEIAHHFVHQYCRKYHKPLKTLSDETLRAMQQYQWPGNVRDLRHSIERAVILSKGDVLIPQDFQLPTGHTVNQDNTTPPKVTETSPIDSPPSTVGTSSTETKTASDAELNLDKVERDTILQALRKNNFIISHAAKDLGITRAALYRRMEKHGI